MSYLQLNYPLSQQLHLHQNQVAGLESGLKKVAKGQTSDINVAEVQRLVSQYRAHAQYEETEFLPLSQTILGRNSHHMAALGMSLHMRHTPAHVNATYI